MLAAVLLWRFVGEVLVPRWTRNPGGVHEICGLLLVGEVWRRPRKLVAELFKTKLNDPTAETCG